MPEQFKYEKRYWYPHMGARDVKIWERFIDTNPGRFDVCIYDLPVGLGAEIDDLVDQDPYKWKEYLTKYKCDVIAFKDGKTSIIEIKPRAGLDSCGQIDKYALLYIEYIDRKSKPQKMIVTDEERSDMRWLCEESNIDLNVV